ncbi:MAG TPA: alcohol dehydrogenase, partial [Verrucomicrobiales bacterium]|nr:alcohol dehydrogenase [Verrucomicrobiales bacterium]
QVAWEEDTFKYGALSAAGDHLIVLSAQGELIIAPASITAFEPSARAQILDGKCWIVPVLSGGLLYARNSDGRLVCLDLRP